MIAKQANISVEGFLANTPLEQQNEMIDRETWKKENYDKYQEEQLMKKYPGKYKQYMRQKDAIKAI